MEIAPNGDLRLVFSGPLQLIKMDFGTWTVLSKSDILGAAKILEQRGELTVRHPDNDSSALSVFDLVGTSTSPYPIELIVALDLPLSEFQVRLSSCFKRIVGTNSPFSAFQVAAAVIRLFRNGFGAVVLVIDLTAREDVSDDEYRAFLRAQLASDSATFVALKKELQAIVQRSVIELCTGIVRYSSLDEKLTDGNIHFLSSFYVCSADWDETSDAEVRLCGEFRPLLHPEPGEPLSNQSNDNREFVMYTSGFHLYIWNRRYNVDHTGRIIALVSFLTLMNILWAELDRVKNWAIEMIESRRAPLFVPTDLDERLEILYNQIMVSSVSWRRDISSFRDEVDHRWRISELKNYCFSLISALEARSARKRAFIVTGILVAVTIGQIFSVIEDGWNIYERLFN